MKPCHLPSAGPIFYSPNGEKQYEILYREYNVISRGFPGWPLSDIKDMAVREREHWVRVLHHRMEMEQWQQMTQAATSRR